MDLKKRFKILFYFILVLSFIWLLGFIYFLFYIPQDTCSHNKVDAIVVLTGGKNRIEEAIGLFHATHAKKILISGVGKGVIKDNFFGLYNKYNIPNEKIILGSLAQNTFGNAEETKIFMELNKFKSLCLVTSKHHLPRSLKIFQEAMPEVEINSYPVFAPNKAYCLSSLISIFIEYNKYLASYFICFSDYISTKYYEFLYRFL